MSWDIYGNQLRRGHCEVHPSVPESYPCAYCYEEEETNRRQNEQRMPEPSIEDMCDPHEYYGIQEVDGGGEILRCYCGQNTTADKEKIEAFKTETGGE